MNIPVVVISGFLGSGKTTLLLRLIDESKRRGLRPGILMNELGKYDVDGHILSEANPEITVKKLLDGCICCSKKSEMTVCIASLLHQSPDVIFIELTGVANPEEIADALTEPSLLQKVYLKQTVTLLDAEHVLEYNSIFSTDKELIHTLRGQMNTADMIVINKTDLVQPSKLNKIEVMARKHNEKATLLQTTQSQIDLGLILNGINRRDKKQVSFRSFNVVKHPAAFQKNQQEAPDSDGLHQHQQQHEHQHIESRSFSRIQSITLHYDPKNKMSKYEMERFLKKWRSQLLRAKGYLAIDESGMVQLMQFAGKRITWEPGHYSGNQYVVFIGIDLDVKLLTEEWNRLIG